MGHGKLVIAFLYIRRDCKAINRLQRLGGRAVAANCKEQTRMSTAAAIMVWGN